MDYSLPDLEITKDLIERIQFSVSSRNAESSLSECGAHVFAARYSDNPRDIDWHYVSSGVACLLRNRELNKTGRKYQWSINLCLYNVNYGVLVWKVKLLPNSDYTAVADNFHVFALGEVDVIVGLQFSKRDQACEFYTTYTRWHQDRMRDDGKKGSISSPSTVATGQVASTAIRFKKEMISKPCNFQHIQGTQALDECLDIEKIKSDIIAAFFGLGTKAGRSETDNASSRKKAKKKKEVVKPRLSFKEISLPSSSSSKSPTNISSPLSSPLASPLALSPSNQPPVINDLSDTCGTPQMDQDQQLVFSLPPVANALQEQNQSDPELINSNSGTYSPQQSLPSPAIIDNGYPGNHQQVSQSVTYEPPQYAEPFQKPRYSEPDLQQHQYDEPDLPPMSVTNGYDGNVQKQHHPYDHLQHSQGSKMSASSIDSYPNFNSNTGQGGYPYDLAPPRLDLSLEKELTESVLFQSTLMTAT